MCTLCPAFLLAHEDFIFSQALGHEAHVLDLNDNGSPSVSGVNSDLPALLLTSP